MGEFIRLTEYYNPKDKEQNFHALNNRYVISIKEFNIIPGKTFAYWIS